MSDRYTMEKTQQSQALETFNQTASVWQQKSTEARTYSLIQNRNALVLDYLSTCQSNSRFLDIGCGTGQLVVEAARRGYEANGIDYSDTMIQYCLENARVAQVKAEFELASIFDLSPIRQEYDLISALGFIEYLSQSELELFLEKVLGMLSVNGKLFLGTRNRLFNVTTLNKFTDIEIELGNFDNLLRQAMAFQANGTPNLDLAFLKEFVGTEPQPREHPRTGVRVDKRYQYSPGEIYGRLEVVGYQLEHLYPVHFHAFPSAFKQDNLGEHERSARFVQDYAPTDLRLVPWCSTLIFVVSRNV